MQVAQIYEDYGGAPLEFILLNRDQWGLRTLSSHYRYLRRIGDPWQMNAGWWAEHLVNVVLLAGDGIDSFEYKLPSSAEIKFIDRGRSLP